MKISLRQGLFAVLLAGCLGVAQAATVHVVLTGAHEVPAVHTMARAMGVIKIGPHGSVSGEITTRGIKATMAHIHLAAAGSNGPPIVSLERGAHHTWVVPAGTRLTPEQYKAFLAGDLYINVHSLQHPAGAIRGQLRP